MEYTASRARRAPASSENPDGNSGDAALIARVASRDEPALRTLYERYCRLIYTIALRIAGDHAVAEEVTQDVFQAVWQSAAHFHPEGNLASWLMGIARHRAIDTTRSRRYRARWRETALADEHSGSRYATEEPTDILLLREALRSALTRLPPAQSQPLTMAYYGGLTHTEIADCLGEPIGTVKSRMRLGLLKLRMLLAGAEESA